MTGDGVNDALALKDADIGVAMGSGSAATRAVAQLVLLDGDFATLPGVVAEGRRVIANIERVANLFLTKTVYAMLLARRSWSSPGWPFPFLPRHLTHRRARSPSASPRSSSRSRRTPSGYEPGFVGRVLRFAVPAGLVARRGHVRRLLRGAHRQVALARPAARHGHPSMLVSLGLLILIRLATPMTKWRKVLVGTMVGAFAVTLVWPFARRFYALSLPGLPMFPCDRRHRGVGVVGDGDGGQAHRAVPAPLRAAHRCTRSASAKEAATRATRIEQGSRTIDLDAPVTRAYPPVVPAVPSAPTRRRPRVPPIRR